MVVDGPHRRSGRNNQPVIWASCGVSPGKGQILLIFPLIYPQE